MGSNCGRAAGVGLGEGRAGKPHDLQGTLDALGVMGREARRGVRVEAGEFGMQDRPAVPRGSVFDGAAQFGVRLRQFRQAVPQGFVVEHGAAHQ